jgi:hypothetical protein
VIADGRCGRGSVAAELPLRAARAVEDDLRRLVVGEVRLPALLVGRQPRGLALGAVRDRGDALGLHPLESRTCARAFGSPPRLKGVRMALNSLRRTLRAVRIAATDKRIPSPLRWLAALGLAPIPGPFDEALLLVVAVPLALFYREPLAAAWKRAAVGSSS